MAAYPENLRAISIAGAWAWLIAKGYKPHEYRSWSTSFRGPVLLHVSSSTENDDTFEEFGVPQAECPKAAIIGAATVTDCFFDEEVGQYAHVMEDVVFFPEPLLGIKGALNYWKPKTPAHQDAFAKAWTLYQEYEEPEPQSYNYLGKKQLATEVLAYATSPDLALSYALGEYTIIFSGEEIAYRGKVLITAGEFIEEDRQIVYEDLISRGFSPEEILPQENSFVGWADLVSSEVYTPETFEADREKHGYDKSLKDCLRASGLKVMYRNLLENNVLPDIEIRNLSSTDVPNGFWMARDVDELFNLQECLQLVYQDS